MVSKVCAFAIMVRLQWLLGILGVATSGVLEMLACCFTFARITIGSVGSTFTSKITWC